MMLLAMIKNSQTSHNIASDKMYWILISTYP